MLRSLYTFWSRISPIVVLLTYLGLIPLFSVVYCLLPGQHFYAPYARMEPLALSDSKEVEKNVTDSMWESYRDHDYSADEWQIARRDIETSDLANDPPNNLKFTVSFFATQHHNGGIVASTGGTQFTAQLSQQKIVTKSRSGWIVCHLVYILGKPLTNEPAVFDNHLLFKSPELPLSADSICWGGPEEIAFQNLVSGWSGDPRGLSGFWLRMLYFSATTITTVGFGDIVPLTTTARILTAVEAIAGWVLAGLFLNSLASRISQKSY